MLKNNNNLLKLSFIVLFYFICSLIILSCKNYKPLNNAKLFKNTNNLSNFSKTSEIKKTFTNSSNNSNSNTLNFIKKDFLIYNSYIKGRVENIDLFYKKIEELAINFEGYIVSYQIINSINDKNKTININLKIPSNKIFQFLDIIDKFFLIVESKNLFVEDVSLQYIDIDRRLKLKKEVEKRLLLLINRTDKVSEIIEIEKSLKEIREEIEVLEGQFNYLINNINYSNVNIEAEIFDRSNSNFFIKLLSSIKTGTKYLLNTFLFIVSLWPFIFLATLIIIVFLKLKKNIKVKQK
ncbi:MAG: DUF4349 domain-containing protein [Spirochaetes bacterium]|nr:DUF4349 domain-containing protein [Spirochaetota bacterium]